MHRLPLVSCCLVLFLGPAASAQLIVSSSSFQTTASASSGLGCSDNDGGVGIPAATASCQDGNGRSALASSEAGLSVSVDGGLLGVAAEATATAIGTPPFQQPNGNAIGTAAAGWQIISGSYHYSLGVESEGGASVNFSDTGGTLPASGTITTGFYSLNLGASANAVANDANGAEIVVATPQSATAEITFAPVGDPDLIQGTVTAFGSGLPGIIVEGLDGSQQVVAQTATGLDGTYLLDDLPGPVAVRATDPEGRYDPQTSAVTEPPATIDFDLTPVTSLPALGTVGLAALALVIALLSRSVTNSAQVTIQDGAFASRRSDSRGARDRGRPAHDRGATGTRTMKPAHMLTTVLVGGVFAFCGAQSAAAQPVVIETVTVGNPGNAGDQPGLLCCSDPSFYGSVAYTFSIGKFEVTAGQYTEFLNAVAATDTHALYHTRMDYDADPAREGCNIERHGAPGSYTYSVAPDWANRPVNYVSWGDAARFANWLHNGQPTGAQDSTTTEDGSYFLDGMTSDSQLEDVVREPDATWVIPTEDEWYKAAYHKNDGVTGNYWNYPTSADSGVSHELIDPDPGNNATFAGGGDWTIGAPYYRTQVGAHENSASPYGTFDQGGNVQEFNETVPEPDIRGIRGGSWFWGGLLGAWERPIDMHSSDQFNDLGFRVANLAPPSQPPVPALSRRGLLVLLLCVVFVGTIVLRPRPGAARSAHGRGSPSTR